MNIDGVAVSAASLPKYVPRRKLRTVGGVYTAYEATQVGLNRSVELRVLNATAQLNSPEMLRFQHELRVLASLDHPNILRIIDCGFMEEHAFYVTDLRDTRDLHELTKNGQPFPIDQVLRIGTCLASALAHLHGRHVLHRDLSAASVFLDRETGVPFIAEFSMARNQTVDSLTLRGIPTLRSLIRTPEALAGRACDVRTDVYLLGQLLFRLVAGQDPPPLNDEESLLGTGIHPRSVNPKVPPELDNFIAKALERRPQDRFATASQMHLELERVTEKLEVKSVLSEIAETTLTEIRVRPTRRISPTDDTMAEGIALASGIVKVKRPAGDTLAEGIPLASGIVKVKRQTGQSMTASLHAVPQSQTKRKVKAVDDKRQSGGGGFGALLFPLAAPCLFIVLIAVLFRMRTDPGTGSGATNAGGYAASVQSVFKKKDVRSNPSRDYSKDVDGMRDRIRSEATTTTSFHARWYLLLNWSKQLSAAKKRLPFPEAELMGIRRRFYKDEATACQDLDSMYESAH
jgi:serine/threonine protein kinase